MSLYVYTAIWSFSRPFLTLNNVILMQIINFVFEISMYELHIGPSKTTRFVIYDMKPPTFTIAYHRLNIQLCSWPLLSKQKKIRGFQKCKVHCCNFKGFKVTSLQSSAWLGFEPGPLAWVNFSMLSDSSGRPGFKSWPGGTLKTCNFEVLKVTAMYFTLLETSSLYLFGQGRSRVHLLIQFMIYHLEWH